jgi:hypothetical protein
VYIDDDKDENGAIKRKLAGKSGMSNCPCGVCVADWLVLQGRTTAHTLDKNGRVDKFTIDDVEYKLSCINFWPSEWFIECLKAHKGQKDNKQQLITTARVTAQNDRIADPMRKKKINECTKRQYDGTAKKQTKYANYSGNDSFCANNITTGCTAIPILKVAGGVCLNCLLDNATAREDQPNGSTLIWIRLKRSFIADGMKRGDIVSVLIPPKGPHGYDANVFAAILNASPKDALLQSNMNSPLESEEHYFNRFKALEKASVISSNKNKQYNDKRRESRDDSEYGVRATSEELALALARAELVINNAVDNGWHHTVSKGTVPLHVFQQFKSLFDQWQESKFSGDLIAFLEKIGHQDLVEAMDRMELVDAEEWSSFFTKCRGPIIIKPDGSAFRRGDFRPGGILYPYISKKCVAFGYSQFALDAEAHIHHSELFDKPGNTLKLKAAGCHNDDRKIPCATFVTTINIQKLLEDEMALLNKERLDTDSTYKEKIVNIIAESKGCEGRKLFILPSFDHYR